MESIDQLGRKLTFKLPPLRIVSLVPSQTELLVDLGLRENIVGITKFCVHPENLKNECSIVGGTKKVHFDKIEALQPDVIICNKEENTKEMVSALEKIAPVWVSDVVTLEDNNNLIASLGALFSVSEKASGLIKAVQDTYEDFLAEIKERPKKKVAYLIWKNPYMTIGDDTFINTLLEINNYQNIFLDMESRYPEISLSDLERADLILLSSEPFPFKEKDVTEIKNALGKEVRLVDGEYFSWYGSRLIKAFSYFKNMNT